MNEIISWFKSLPTPIQIVTIMAGWTVIFLWLTFIVGNIDWCPESSATAKYYYDRVCSIDWINFASILTMVILWLAGLLGTAMYYDCREEG